MDNKELLEEIRINRNQSNERHEKVLSRISEIENRITINETKAYTLLAIIAFFATDIKDFFKGLL